MGGFFKDINEGGMIMQLLYLNDWSMQGGGSLTSQWSKVERWYEISTFLSSTYGIAKVGVPHDFRSRKLCDYVLSDSYIPDNSLLPAEKRQLLLAILDSHIQKADYNDSTTRVVNDENIESSCIGRAYEQKACVLSFTFDEKNENATISGTIKLDGGKEQGCTVHNLYDKNSVIIDYLVPCSISRQYKAIENPMWNQDMMKAYCEKIGHTANRKSATTGEKISYLRTHGGILAVMNGWIVDENKTKLNQNKDHQRLIFRSAHFKDDNCYLSIDFEKEDFHYELLDHRGKHIKEINWHGNQTGGKDPTHNILIKKV